MRQARQLCKEAIVVKGDYEAFSKYSRIVTEILTEAAPIVEKRSIDEHYLDLTGMDRYFGCVAWCRSLRERVMAETGLPISFGLSANKLVSKVATGEAKPNGWLEVKTGEEKNFLSPLPVRKIPMVGPKLTAKLSHMGIDTVGALQQMPAGWLEKMFGADGITASYTADASGNIDRNIDGLVKVWCYAGGSASTYNQAPAGYSITASTAYSNVPNWTSSFAMNDLIFVVVQVTYSRARGTVGLPNITVALDNSLTQPGDVLYDYLTNTRYGAGIPVGDIYAQ
jgi:hypothetical protein